MMNVMDHNRDAYSQLGSHQQSIGYRNFDQAETKF